MSQNAPEFRINFGGGRLHAHAILEASYLLFKGGWKFENPHWMGLKTEYKAIPDVYVSKTERGVKRYYIVEIETHATRASIEKKNKQYNIANHELLIIDLTHMIDEEDLSELNRLIKERLP
jgi:hypothetical protein